MLNGVVGYQLMDDGTALSMLLILGSAAAVFVGTGYIALDTGFNWTGYWNTALIQQNPNREYSMYTLYLLAPLVFLFVFFALESVLVLTVLGEVKPMRKCTYHHITLRSLKATLRGTHEICGICGTDNVK